jgi:hypothetical protein
VTPPKRCRVCGARPTAWAGVAYCFECWPGGPVIPPPCLRCGSRTDYYRAGVCVRCHERAPQRVESCRDCLAWGATRTTKWLCKGCGHWRSHYTVARCPVCGRQVPVHPEGACRLCRRQRSVLLRQGRRVDAVEANRDGQQLFFADMAKAARRAPTLTRQVLEPPVVIGPVAHRQGVLFTAPWDPHAAFGPRFPPPRDPELAAALHCFVADYARRFGWSPGSTERTQRGVRILLGVQDTPGAPILRSDVMLLSEIGISAKAVGDALEAAGMLEEDRVPTVVRWFETKIAGLPEDMRDELSVWFEVKRHGRSTPPRFQARNEATIKSQLRFALPALTAWAAVHASLREISRDDLRAVLPAGGSARACMLQGLRSIFRVLKAVRLVFVNPTTHMSVPKAEMAAPAPIDLSALRQALDSPDRTRAALAALLAFHAVRISQIRLLDLTDSRDGRLYLDDHVVVLADPVRHRLDAYLDERGASYPNSPNPHLFIHWRNAMYLRPVTPWWIRRRLGMSGQAIRQDRILDEAHATAGDVRQVCDLFGLSVAMALRYTATVARIANLDHPDT